MINDDDNKDNAPKKPAPHDHFAHWKPAEQLPKLTLLALCRVNRSQFYDISNYLYEGVKPPRPGLQDKPRRRKSGRMTIGLVYFDKATGLTYFDTLCHFKDCDYRGRSIYHDEQYRSAKARGILDYDIKKYKNNG